MSTPTTFGQAHARHGHHASLDDALDFVNTYELTRDGHADRLPDAASVVAWLEAHDLLHRETADELVRRAAADDVVESRMLGRVRRVRAALREVLDATVESRAPAGSALREVNRALRTQYVQQLVPGSDGVSLGHRHEGDALEGALARLAEAVAREVTADDRDRLRICDNETCRWVFKDESPGGRRRWCSMASCGNRAKVARHRERLRAASS
jgi:predicted RNA-binding Zn ribbon-like protein